MIEKEKIILAYNLFLNREPENEDVIAEKQQCKSLTELINEFIFSHEYKDKHQNEASFSTQKYGHYLSFKEAKWAISFELNNTFKGIDPTLSHPVSQLCTASQFSEYEYDYWRNQIKEDLHYHRKQWEYIYILNALEKNGMLQNGKHGLGFGCGKEPLASVMAAHNVNVTVTDVEPEKADGWIKTNQHTSSLDDLYNSEICQKDLFVKNVDFRFVDMNNIPSDFFNSFDFVWSSCALEHLGSLENGINFIKNSLKCLKQSGSIAVHTTEFNLSSNDWTFESPGLSFFRKKDIDKLYNWINNTGEFIMEPINYCAGNIINDEFIDLPPYTKSYYHLKLLIKNIVSTSIGLIIKKI